MSESKTIALTSSRERPAQTFSGYLMLLVLLVAIIAQVLGIFGLANGGSGAFIHIAAVIVAPLVLLFVACGFYMLQPNQAAAITLFGSYRGTDRVTGLRRRKLGGRKQRADGRVAIGEHLAR